MFSINSNCLVIVKDLVLCVVNCVVLGILVNWVDIYLVNCLGVSGGNLNLKLEEVKILLFGFVWQLEFLEGFGMLMDYWCVILIDVIGLVFVQILVICCVDLFGGVQNNLFCDFIKCVLVGGYILLIGIVFLEYSIYNWVVILENLVKLCCVGVDLEMDYCFNLLGGFIIMCLVGICLIQLCEWVFQLFLDEFIEYVMYYIDLCWCGQFIIMYKCGDWCVLWDMIYVDGNLCVILDSYNFNLGLQSLICNLLYLYYNMQVGYKFLNLGIDVYVGVDNVFDKDLLVNYFGVDVGVVLYDSIGCYMYMGIIYKF